MTQLYRNLSMDETLIMGLTLRSPGNSAYPENSLNMARYINDDDHHVTLNYQALAQQIGLDINNWVLPIQNHGSQIVEITACNKGSNVSQLSHHLKDVDGLWTTETGILLGMCFADCTPIYFYSDNNPFIGLVHAGWRGTVQQIQLKLLNIYLKNHYKLEDLKIVIGPSICDKCYHVSYEILQHFLNFNLSYHDYYQQIAEDTYQINIAKFNYILLCEAGISPNNIVMSNECTSCDNQHYFSYRKECGRTGRMLGFIGRKYHDN